MLVLNRCGTCLLLAALTTGAIGLRNVGIGHGLPHRVEPDSVAVLRQTEAFWNRGSDEPSINKPTRAYPLLLARVASLTDDPRGAAPSGSTLEEHLRRAAAPHRRIRTVVSVLSAMVVPATWLLARCFLGSGAAFMAAAFMAVSLIDVIFSQQGRPHAPAGVFITLAVAASVRLRRKPTLLAHAAAALAAGLAVATLQSAVLVLGAVAAAILLRERTSRKARIAGPVICAALVAGISLAFLAESSGAARPEHIDSAAGRYFRLSGHPVYYSLFNGSGFSTLIASFWSLENLTSILAVVGLAFWLAGGRGEARRPGARSDLAVVLAFVLPYFLLFGMYQKTGTRIGIPLLPFLACMAAFGLSRIGAVAPLLRNSRAAAVTLALLVFAVPSAAAWRLVDRRAELDTATRASRWIAANVDPGARVALVSPLELPLVRRAEALRVDSRLGWSSPWRRYLAALDEQELDRLGFDLRAWPLSVPTEMAAAASDPAVYFRTRATQYVVMMLSRTEGVRLFGEGLRKAMRDLAWMANSLPAPEEEGLPLMDWGFEPKDGVNWTWRLLGDFRAGGETVEIYEVGN